MSHIAKPIFIVLLTLLFIGVAAAMLLEIHRNNGEPYEYWTAGASVAAAYLAFALTAAAQ